MHSVRQDDKMRIFVSYTTRDTVISENFLRWVSNQLNASDKSFIDILHNDSKNSQSRVEKELHSADILLLLDSDSIKDSSWVNWELQQAKVLGIPIIKIQVDNCVDLEQVSNDIRESLKFNSELRQEM